MVWKTISNSYIDPWTEFDYNLTRKLHNGIELARQVRVAAKMRMPDYDDDDDIDKVNRYLNG